MELIEVAGPSEQREGTTSFCEVVPQVVLIRGASGDADQGGEMQVLA